VPALTGTQGGYTGAIAPIEFKFVKDDEFADPQGSPMDRGFEESAAMQAASRLDAEVAAHDRKVRELAAQPLTAQNMESQIQELLNGQEALRFELENVKLQVNRNSNELEALRNQMQTGQAPMQPMQPMPMPSVQPMQQSIPSVPMATSRSVNPPSQAADDKSSKVWANMGYDLDFGSSSDYYNAAKGHATNLFSRIGNLSTSLRGQ